MHDPRWTQFATRRAARVTLAIVGVFLLLVAAFAMGYPGASVSPAPFHETPFTATIHDGQLVSVSIAGDEDPWAARVMFKGVEGGVKNPQLGTAHLTASLLDGQESAWIPIDLKMGTQDLQAETDGGAFQARVEYHEGLVPTIFAINITPDGFIADASDPNEASGDHIASYAFTLVDSSGKVLAGPTEQATNVFRALPTQPGSYAVSVVVTDLRGATSATITKDFKILAALSQNGGASISEGDASVTRAATNQLGKTIVEKAKPGGGVQSLAYREAWGLLKLFGCPIVCSNPLVDGWLQVLPPGIKNSIAEAFT